LLLLLLEEHVELVYVLLGDLEALLLDLHKLVLDRHLVDHALGALVQQLV
jgi:hypothetical protein